MIIPIRLKENITLGFIKIHTKYESPTNYFNSLSLTKGTQFTKIKIVK